MPENKRLLIVDDEPHIRRVLQAAFEKDGYSVSLAECGEDALVLLKEAPFECMLSDITMPGMNGHELLRSALSLRPELPVVLMTAYGAIPSAVQAIREGAFEYVTKPFDLDALKRILRNAMTDEDAPKKRRSKKGSRPEVEFIAESPEMRELLETMKLAADSKATVLITGESGTGKEVVAKTIHRLSTRRDQPFVAVSCAALPETLLESELFGYEKGAFTGAQDSKQGRFELADKGTLFLDEIGDVPPAIQVKLLRVLQEREFERLGSSKPTRVDVRLLAATNRDLNEAVQEGEFRLDLLYRLQVVELRIPPLRERKADIEPLAKLFLQRYCTENERDLMELTPEVKRLLQAYHWPGNVRELENVIERGVVLSPRDAREFLPKMLPTHLQDAA